MTELQPGHKPSPNVWKRIALELDRQRDAGNAAARRGAPARAWRAFAIASAFATLAAAAVGVKLFGDTRTLSSRNVQLVSQLNASPDIRYVAMLSDDKSAPQVMVTFDPKHNTLTLKRIGDFREGEEKSLQLWALPPGSAPKSLGVLPQGGVVKLTAAEGQVKEAPALAISLEPKGGVPGEGGPTGPVLFKGAVVPTS